VRRSSLGDIVFDSSRSRLVTTHFELSKAIKRSRRGILPKMATAP
jgi:hypothetical protein